MAPLYRQEQILELLEERSYVGVAELASLMKCSDMTIRRDLAQLATKGLVRRSRGGAAPSSKIRLEFALAGKYNLRRAEKEAIGLRAAELIERGSKVLVDVGTTSLALARALRDAEGLSVVTTSLAVVSELLGQRGIEIMLLGGTLRENSADLYGPLVEENLSRLHCDWAFVGCDGLSVSGGATASDPRTARATALMMASAKRSVLITDSSKAENDSFYGFATFSDFDYLITDDAMPAEIMDSARASGVEVITVSAGS